MTSVELEGAGEIVSFTPLHSPPAGFRSPLHLALVALPGGARFICHGAETRGLRIGSRAAIEAGNNAHNFPPLSPPDHPPPFLRGPRLAGARSPAIAPGPA